MKNPFYYHVHHFFRPIVTFFFPIKVHGIENVPTDRPVIFCANHTSGFDPVLLCCAFRSDYPVRLMAKKQLFSIPGLAWLIRNMGAFPVDRGHGDISAVKNAIGCLRDGGSLIIFPEGTRIKNGQRIEPKSGAAMIAIRAGVQMVPVYIKKAKGMFRKTPVVFGAPYDPVYAGRKGTAEEYQHNTDEVMDRAYALGETLCK